jgi:peptidoglycan/LPS O-acetylase OafA/YrhL
MAFAQNNSGARNRFDGIDVLRGLSIVAVVLHHINLRMMFNDVSFEKFLPAQLGKILFWNGANGVTVFFAISGFLITTTASRRSNSLGELSVPAFYRLRFARIAPLLLALLAVLSILHLTHVSGFRIDADRASLPRALFAALTFHVNWLESTHGYLPGSWDVLWSLSVEEVFYLFFPLFCKITRGRAAFVVLLLLFVGIGPLARTVLTKNSLWADYGYLSSMDCIAMGCLAALLARAVQLPKGALRGLRVLGAGWMALILLARPVSRWLHLYELGLDVSALAFGTCLVMLALAQENRSGSRPTRLLRWFGRNSYEVYLTHMFLVMWSVQIFLALGLSLRWAPPLYLLVLAASGVLGAAVARWYSEPMNRKLRHGIGPDERREASAGNEG